MNKLFTKIAGAALGLAMAIGVGVAVGTNSKKLSQANATSATWELVTAAPADWSGEYILCNGSSGTVKMMNVSDFSGGVNFSGIDVTVTNSKIIADDSNAITISASEAGTANKYSIVANDYWIGRNANSNGVDSGPTSGSYSTNYDNSISYSNGKVVIAGNGSRTLTWYASNSNFRYYASSNNCTQLFKRAANTAVSSVSVAPTAVTLGVGATQQLTPTVLPDNATDKSVSYSSNANGIATVSNTGLITAVAAGNATITVTTTDGGKTATCAVTVIAPVAVTGVSLNKNSTSLEVGATETLTATVAPNDASNKTINWSTSDANVATVAGGVVTAAGKGSATITATTADGGYTATCNVTVTAPTSITFVAGTDTGATSVAKSGVTVGMSTMSRDDNYRCYSGTAVTISSTIGNIDSIAFTFDGASYTGGFETTYINIGATSWTSANASGQARFSQIVVTLESTDPSVALAPTSADSVSMMKGDTNTSVKVLVKNIDDPEWAFTFDENENNGLSTSSYISVAASALDGNGIATLSITTKAVGSTTLHISVSGTACEDAVPVTVNARPASGTMVAKLESVVVDSAVEVQNGHYKQFTFAAEDTDGNPYVIAAADVTGAKQSGTAELTISGTRVTGNSVGSAVVRYTLNALNSVYVDIEIDVIDDYNESVNAITFNNNLTATQGESVDVAEVFASKVADTHFGSTAQIDNSELLFAYDNNRNVAVALNMFAYDFSHGSSVDATHKTQVIYVFVTFNAEYWGSFTITVEQADDPLTAIALTNAEIVAGEVDIARGGSLQLTWALTPENPTDGRELEFSVDDNDEGVNVSVSSTGLISVAANSGLGCASILVEAAHNHSIYTYLLVNVGLESMTYQVNEEATWTLVTDESNLAAGDHIIITDSDSTMGLKAYDSGNNCKAAEVTVSGSTLTDIGDAVQLVLSDADNGNFYLYDGANYLFAASSSGNQLKGKNSTDSSNGAWKFEYSTDHMSIVADGSSNRNVMQYNSINDGLFACYASASQTNLQVYKMSGGLSNKDVTEALFNAVHNNFGENKTYAWDATCASFNSSNWNTAGAAVTGIASFANYKLNRAVANANGNEIEKFLAKYDVVVDKFGTAYDFLGRFTNGGINYAAPRINNPFSIGADTNNNALFVVIILVSVAAAGGYFVFRKRKEY